MTLRAFISYARKDQQAAQKVQRSLENDYGIEGFLALNRISGGQDWRSCLLKELASSRILVTIVSQAFRQSDWASQEVGLAFSQEGLTVIPFQLDDTTPFGFLSMYQGIPWNGLNAPHLVSSLMLPILLERFTDKVLRMVITRQLKHAGTFASSETLFQYLRPYFSQMPPPLIQQLAVVSCENSQIWGAYGCVSKHLPEFFEVCGKHIDPSTQARLQEKMVL